MKGLTYLSISFYFFISLACRAPANDQTVPAVLINTSHLDHLYQELKLPEVDTFAIIHIYSEYPNYQWVGDTDEGIACVDDVARAIIFYLRNYHYSRAIKSLEKAEQLLQFLLFMQAENGYFYNFIYSDYSINKTGVTSRAEPNWWSWRALWALGEASEILDAKVTDYDRLITARNRLMDAIILDFDRTMVDSFIRVDGFDTPQWLPGKNASDQAALLVLGLAHAQIYREEEIKIMLDALLSGIMKMQIHNDKKFPHGAFLSWQNIWHAYGNSQSYALLKISKMMNDPNLALAAITEIQYFFNDRIIRDNTSHFTAKITGHSVVLYDSATFPQIAYNIRPVIWACLEAARHTGSMEYVHLAQKASQWFAGENPARTVMYNSLNGRCFDGINGVDNVNRNAGAESTIEALLALQELYYFKSN